MLCFIIDFFIDAFFHYLIEVAATSSFAIRKYVGTSIVSAKEVSQWLEVARFRSRALERR